MRHTHAAERLAGLGPQLAGMNQVEEIRERRRAAPGQ
jgi:hypothetical protein